MTQSQRRIWLAGALTVPVLGLALIGATVRFWPQADGLRTLARIADSLAPQMLALALAGVVALAALGARRAALAGLVLVLAGGGGLAARHLAQSQPQAADAAALTVLWFNMLGNNSTPPEQLIAALAESPADLIVVAEAGPLRNHLAALDAHFPQQAGCRGKRCDLLVLARSAAADAALSVREIGRASEERLALAWLELPGRAPLTVLGLHMVKPWFFGFAEHDEWHALNMLEQITGPLLVAGDFNAAPWSHRMQGLAVPCGLHFVRRPLATWPVAAGGLGVPIDLMLTRDSARLVSMRIWGDGLGSNHRGLLAGVALPAASPPVPPRPDCRVPG